MTMTRRDFLSASAALAAMPAPGGGAVAAPVPRDADIVVIGAGAAGIAAARRIMAANRKVIVVEATGRIGGRCETDASSFEVPFDRGARWMHNPETNPMIRLGRAAGLEITSAPSGQKIRIGRRFARPGETEEFLAALVRANRAIDDASRKGDISCATVLPKDLSDWAGTAEFVLGANFAGKDLRDVSVVDKARAQDRTTAIGCRQGLGTLIAKLGGQLPVSLSTPANRISWSNRDVMVETPAGKITARAAIITVSSNVLAAGNIKFAPDIPKRALDAAAKLSLGSYDRIALQMPGNPLGLSRDDILIEQSNSTRTALLYANMGGSSLCTIDVAGSFGRDLSAQGEQAMSAFAVEWLSKAVRKRGCRGRQEIKRNALERATLCAGRDVGRGARARKVRARSSPIRSAACTWRARRPMRRCGGRSTAPGRAANARPKRRCDGSARWRPWKLQQGQRSSDPAGRQATDVAVKGADLLVER